MIGTTELMLIFVVLIILILLIVLAAHLLIKHIINRNKAHGVEGKSASDIAKERYAKGEITKEELEEIKRNLM